MSVRVGGYTVTSCFFWHNPTLRIYSFLSYTKHIQAFSIQHSKHVNCQINFHQTKMMGKYSEIPSNLRENLNAEHWTPILSHFQLEDRHKDKRIFFQMLQLCNIMCCLEHSSSNSFTVHSDNVRQEKRDLNHECSVFSLQPTENIFCKIFQISTECDWALSDIIFRNFVYFTNCIEYDPEVLKPAGWGHEIVTQISL